MRVRAGATVGVRQNWEQHLRSFVANRQHPMFEGAWWCLRALWLEWSAETMGIQGCWEGGRKPENRGTCGPHIEVWSLSKV